MSTREIRSLGALQLIVFAMIAGVGGLSVVALFVARGMEPQPELGRILLPVLGLLAFGQIVGWVVISRVTLNGARARYAAQDPPPTPDELLPAFATRTILAAALAESFGMAGAVFYLITAITPLLAAPLIAVFLLGLLFPTRDKLANFASSVTNRQVL